MLSGPIIEYEKILCGEREKFSFSYVNLNANTYTLREILRYAVEQILCWTPEEMADRFTNELIARLHLRDVVVKIPFPADLNRDVDTFYYADFLYPGSCIERRKEAALKYYTANVITVNSKKWSWIPPKEENGIYLFNFLGYALEHNAYGVDPDDLPSLYRFFGFRRRINAFLKDMGIMELCILQYPFPIDMLQDYLCFTGKETDTDRYMYYRCMYYMSDKKITLTG